MFNELDMLMKTDTTKDMTDCEPPMSLQVVTIQIESTDEDFVGRLVDFLNTAPVKPSSTVVRVLDPDTEESTLTDGQES